MREGSGRLRIKRRATASWQGTTSEGSGRLGVGSGAFEGAYSERARVEDLAVTNPEELVGAAHAGCFTMSVANLLGERGTPAEGLNTTATVYLERLDGRFSITRIELVLTGRAAGLDEETFQRLAREAKDTCPVSRALAGTEIELSATLEER
jgi:osmotically inducible protein OsmC